MRDIKQQYILVDKASSVAKNASDKITDSIDDIESKSEQTTSSMSSSWSSFAKVILAGSVVTAFRGVISAASDLQETTGKFNVVFANNMHIATQSVEELRTEYGLSEESAKRYLASIQDLLVPMGMASDAAANMSDEVVKLSVDLGSFNNQKTEKVMEDIQSALVGNYETMKKYGVVLTAAAVEQKAFEMGLAETKDELTASDKALAAYQIIVQSSAAAMGDFARTSDSFANQIKILQSHFQDIQSVIGNELLPGITSLVKFTNELITSNGELSPIIKTVASGMSLLVKELLLLASVKGAMLLWDLVKAGKALALVMVSNVSASITNITNSLAIVADTAAMTAGRFGMLKGAAYAVGMEFATLGPAFAAVGIALSGLVIAMRHSMEDMTDVEGKIKDISAALKNMSYDMQKATLLTAIFEQTKAVEEAREAWSELADEAARGMGSDIMADKAWEEFQRRNQLLDEYKSKLKEINQLSKNDEAILKEKEKTELTKKQLENLEKIKEEIIDRNYKLSHTAMENEIQDVKNHYNKMIEEAGNNSDLIKQIEETKNKEIQSILDKYYKEALNKSIQEGEKIAEEDKKLKERLKKQAEELVETRGQITDEINSVVMDQYDYERMKIEEQYQNYRKVYGDIIALDEWKARKLKKISERETEDKKTDLQRWEDSVKTSSEFIADMWMDASEQISSGMTNALFDYIDGTKSAADAARQFFAELLRNLAQAIIQYTILNALKNSGWGSSIVSLFGSANGNVFNNGQVQAFANGGVIGGPVVFPMANGMGLAGEAGPEAIMPLKRGTNGRLGVEVQGGDKQSGVTIQNNITIENGNALTDEGEATKVFNQMSTMMKEQMKQVIAGEMRVGGMLNTSINRRVV